MRKTRIMIGLLVTALLTLGLVFPAAAQVEPPVVEAELAPGESMTLIKEVTTPPIPPNPDIYFVSDTTGSMGDVIEAVADDADDIMAAILSAQPTAQFGAGNYRDYPGTVPPFVNQESITDDTTAVSGAINAWSAVGGGDGPEAQLYVLDRLADGTGIGWRGIGTKIVVWFGDAPGHDPVPQAATGLGYDITEATVTADLVAAGIKVIAISIDTGYYDDGTDDDPMDGGGDYAASYGIVEDGTAGQASRIAAATGGAYLFAATPEEAADAVLAGIEQLTTDVWWEVVECDLGLNVELFPVAFEDVPGGTTVEFGEIIVLDDDAPQCHTLYAKVVFIANEWPEEGEVIGEQEIYIHVADITPPEVWCIEGVNPAGKNIPPAGSTTMPGSKGGQNEDGFYQLIAVDNCDPDPLIIVGYWDVDAGVIWLEFGPFGSGVVVKFTEAPGAEPSIKKIGSDKGQGGAVACHITLPGEPVVVAIDASGNLALFPCFVPPIPK